MYPADPTGVYASRILEFGFSCCNEKKVGENFVIVFTDAQGTLEFVFCHWPNTQLILCISSALPWCACFHGLLDIISRNELYRESRWPAFQPFLSRLLSTRPPPQPIDYVTCQDPFSVNRHLKFRIPSSNSPHNLKYVMEYYNALDVSLWIHVFVCLILERSVLFYSKRLSRLTACVIAAVSLLHPLQWVHSFYPLIPKKVIEVLGCPAPFVAGIHSCNLQAAMEHVNSGTCVVDLDAGRINLYQSSESTENDSDGEFATPKAVYEFLRRHLKDLQRQLNSAMRLNKASDSNWKRVDGEACQFFEQLTKPFFYMIANLLGCYSDCIVNNRGSPEVDIDLLIARQKCPGLEPFFRTLCEAQAVQLFLDGRVRNPPDPSTDAFESFCLTLRGSNKQGCRKQRLSSTVSAPSTPVPIAVTLNGSTLTSNGGSGLIRGQYLDVDLPSFGTQRWVQSKKLKNPGEPCSWDKQKNIAKYPKNAPTSAYSWANISQKLRAQAITLRNLSSSKEMISSRNGIDRRATIGITQDDVDTRCQLEGYRPPRPSVLPEVRCSPLTGSTPGLRESTREPSRLPRPTSTIARNDHSKILSHIPTEWRAPRKPDAHLGTLALPVKYAQTIASQSTPEPKPKPPPRPPPPQALQSITAAEARSRTVLSQPDEFSPPILESPILPVFVPPSHHRPVQNFPTSICDTAPPRPPLDTVASEAIVPNLPPTRAFNSLRGSTRSRTHYTDCAPPPIPPRNPSIRSGPRLFAPSPVGTIRLAPASNLLHRRLASRYKRTTETRSSLDRVPSPPLRDRELETKPTQTLPTSGRQPSYENVLFGDGNAPTATIPRSLHLPRSRSETIHLPLNPNLYQEVNKLNIYPSSSLQHRSRSTGQLANGDSYSLKSRDSGHTDSSAVENAVWLKRKYATFAERRRTNRVPYYRLHRARTVSVHRSSAYLTSNANNLGGSQGAAPIASEESNSIE
ncbi:hypothetical protein CRM22_005264 [Opisthorchis felineus]|nr:hypothetical protein CRM22_005264 [Opisthorchis felineus]